jgi:hypothetical protein
VVCSSSVRKTITSTASTVAQVRCCGRTPCKGLASRQMLSSERTARPLLTLRDGWFTSATKTVWCTPFDSMAALSHRRRHHRRRHHRRRHQRLGFRAIPRRRLQKRVQEVRHARSVDSRRVTAHRRKRRTSVTLQRPATCVRRAATATSLMASLATHVSSSSAVQHQHRHHRRRRQGHRCRRRRLLLNLCLRRTELAT